MILTIIQTMAIVQLPQLLCVRLRPGIHAERVLSLGGRLEDESELFELDDDGTSRSRLINEVRLHPVDDVCNC